MFFINIFFLFVKLFFVIVCGVFEFFWDVRYFFRELGIVRFWVLFVDEGMIYEIVYKKKKNYYWMI